MNKNSENLTVLSKENIGDVFGELIGWSLEQAPYLGNLLQTIKIRRMSTRIIKNEEKLKRIQSLMISSNLSSEYIQRKIGPIVISDLIEEHEESKINYILNGFQNIFIEEKEDESLMYHFLDTLRALRYADIRRLFYHAELDEKFPAGKDDESEDKRITYTFAKSLDDKLDRMGLLFIPAPTGVYAGDQEVFHPDNRLYLSAYGNEFIKFITV